MSKLQRKRKASKKLTQSKPLGFVVREYAQFNVSPMYIQEVAEALGAAILSDYYTHVLRQNRVTEDSENGE